MEHKQTDRGSAETRLVHFGLSLQVIGGQKCCKVFSVARRTVDGAFVIPTGRRASCRVYLTFTRVSFKAVLF